MPTFEIASNPTLCLRCCYIYDSVRMVGGYLYVHCEECLDETDAKDDQHV
jgi:uncharacterized protein YcgL (UPF0745 family)